MNFGSNRFTSWPDRPDRCDTVGRSLSPRMMVSLLSDLRPPERGRNALVGGGIRRETLRQGSEYLSGRPRQRQPR